MSLKYEVNIAISGGCSFSQEFFVRNPDMSAVDITGATIVANLAKHPKAIFANDTTSSHSYWNYIPFTCYVENGPQGIFSLNLTEAQTILLEEGKYVFSATMKDANGVDLGEVVYGLAFVTFAMNPTIGTIGPDPDAICVGY